MGFAERMNSLPKYMVSITLKEAGWSNSSIVAGDLFEQVSNLNQQPGQDLRIAGSGTLAHSLASRGLIDEYRLLVYPVVLGRGKRLFAGDEKIDLKQVQMKKFNSGVVLM
jgi:dihydrofolate reductase